MDPLQCARSCVTASDAVAQLQVWNPCFDVTPGSLIEGIITEEGVVPRDPATGLHKVAAFMAARQQQQQQNGAEAGGLFVSAVPAVAFAVPAGEGGVHQPAAYCSQTPAAGQAHTHVFWGSAHMCGWPLCANTRCCWCGVLHAPALLVRLPPVLLLLFCLTCCSAGGAKAKASSSVQALDAAGVVSFISARPQLAARVGPPGSESSWTVQEVGDGNINFVFIVQVWWQRVGGWGEGCSSGLLQLVVSQHRLLLFLQCVSLAM